MLDPQKGIATGLALGVAFGVAFNSLALGIALGIACGAMYDRKASTDLEKEQPPTRD
jgi:hypothetical protein